MSSFSRKMLPAVALATMLSAPLAQAQTSDQDHGAHHRPHGHDVRIRP
ncbi:hypothetical protein [Azospirillum isscasi]|uniref:Uncharacterized protein n=1 Tax=Azospirillum isscasi TaxID=3053926 RepID=A0ABU0WF40_9PROT|nr:hypothetical protein [Azospirillum isscasi]MDQ2102775.1 hypothetical protein [Azospirillum isscasi]